MKIILTKREIDYIKVHKVNPLGLIKRLMSSIHEVKEEDKNLVIDIMIGDD